VLASLIKRSELATRLAKLLAIAFSAIAAFASLVVLQHVLESGIVVYYFGGFKPPLGIVYVVDALSALFAFLSMTMLLVTCIYSYWFMGSKWSYLYYSLLFLMAAGSVGCIYTGDLFNLYVAAELLAISCYALVAYYRDSSRAIMASLRYAISGSIAISILFFSVVVIYGAYGTLNMADIALKMRDPLANVPFSGRVVGDITLPTKVAVSLMVWVFLFKIGIVPIGFAWQPHAYAEAPTPISAGMTAIADSAGLYLFIRLFYTILGKDVELLYSFRLAVLGVVQVVAVFSAIIAALLMCVEGDVKKFIAYSTISQFSLALLGACADSEVGVASAILTVISNILGDATLFYIAGLAIVACGRGLTCMAVATTSKLIFKSMLIAMLNLFGILPVLVGFWAKALLVMAYIEKSVVIVALVLVISGITAVGYFRVLHVAFTHKPTLKRDERLKETAIPLATILALTATTVALGLLFALSMEFRELLLKISLEVVVNSKEYINVALGFKEIVWS